MKTRWDKWVEVVETAAKDAVAQHQSGTGFQHLNTPLEAAEEASRVTTFCMVSLLDGYERMSSESRPVA